MCAGGVNKHHLSSGHTHGGIWCYKKDLNTNQWVAKGQNLDGTPNPDIGESTSYAGYMGQTRSIALDRTGNTLITGMNAMSQENGPANAGKVMVWAYDSSTNQWVPKGQSIYGASTYSRVGNAVDISDDGNIMVFAQGWTSYSPAYVTVMTFDANSQQWVERGKFEGNGAGWQSVQLSANGNIVAYRIQGAGLVKVQYWDGSSWSQQIPSLQSLRDTYVPANAAIAGPSTTDAATPCPATPCPCITTDAGVLVTSVPVPSKSVSSASSNGILAFTQVGVGFRAIYPLALIGLASVFYFMKEILSKRSTFTYWNISEEEV
jgi:hypothetical protein